MRKSLQKLCIQFVIALKVRLLIIPIKSSKIKLHFKKPPQGNKQ
jgi:hypothetical protein